MDNGYIEVWNTQIIWLIRKFLRMNLDMKSRIVKNERSSLMGQ